MALFDDDMPKGRAAPHVVGADLSALSVEELKERVTILQAEMDRIEQEIAAKIAVKSAADNIFRA